jgi:hypothetical protein
MHKARAFFFVCAGIFLLALAYHFWGSDRGALGLTLVAGTPGFIMSDNLMGTVLKSSARSDVGKKITFVGLLTDAPKIVFESGLTSPVQKVYEGPKTMTLVLVASGTGSVDAFVIDKETGKFSRGEASVFVDGPAIASASVGTCK